jgi:HlyD family secretion protein
MSSRFIRIGLPILVLAALAGGGAWWFSQRAGRIASAAVQTAAVTTITAVTRVESSGAIQALQTASLSWKTTGQVARVYVQPGDRVEADEVLMELDPLSAPANVIAAQADLIAAQTALDNLLKPTELSIANAQKAVADAQKQLDEAERKLRNLTKPNVSYYEEQYAKAQEKLTQAQQNLEKTNIGDLVKAVQNAKDTLKKKTDQLNDVLYIKQNTCPNCDRVFAASVGRFINLEDAQKEYDDAVNALRTAEINLAQARANNSQSVEDAQDALETAQANLNAAKAGPKDLDRLQAEASVAVAQAQLLEAQKTLNELLNGAEAADLAAARARLQSAQATVNSLAIKAPFAGEVLSVNYLAGDLVDQSKVAVVIANRTQLHVDVPVDETEVARIQTGDTVSVTLDALADTEFTGIVDWINPVGQTVQGIVKYTVRVKLQTSDSALLLGATANTAIVTDVRTDVLAVPLDAVQNDAEGEFVNRVNADSTRTRISVTSGTLEDDLVTITLVNGDLQKGDKVELIEPRPSTQTGGPFGGG